MSSGLSLSFLTPFVRILNWIGYRWRCCRRCSSCNLIWAWWFIGKNYGIFGYMQSGNWFWRIFRWRYGRRCCFMCCCLRMGRFCITNVTVFGKWIRMMMWTIFKLNYRSKVDKNKTKGHHIITYIYIYIHMWNAAFKMKSESFCGTTQRTEKLFWSLTYSMCYQWNLIENVIHP